MYTTDPNDPDLKRGIDTEQGAQNKKYLVLSEEERDKGFVRPYRESYTHLGKKLHYHSINRVFDKAEKSTFNNKYYVAVMNVMGSEGKIIGGAYVTKEELSAWEKGDLVGGCKTSTIMSRPLAETYARNPSFYGATFCCGCNKHLPVDEFVWDGTNDKVGS